MAVPRWTTRPPGQRRQTRRTAAPARDPTGPGPLDRLFQLATEIPAAVLARMLGIHIKVAVHWQHVSAGDWTSYAADVSRRPIP